jgi:hypothetical protein
VTKPEPSPIGRAAATVLLAVAPVATSPLLSLAIALVFLAAIVLRGPRATTAYGLVAFGAFASVAFAVRRDLPWTKPNRR